MKYLVVILFIALSMTDISVASVGKAPLTPFHLLMALYIGYVTLFSKKSALGLPMLLVLLGGFFLVNNVINYPAIRLTSLIYSLAFVAEMILLYNLLKQSDKAQLEWIFVVILGMFFANILLATFAMKIGHTRSLAGGLIGITETVDGSRPCGFSSEPSYAAFIVSICFLCWNNLRNYAQDKAFYLMLSAYALSVVLLGSAYGILLALVVGLGWVWYYFKRFDTALKLVLLVPFILMARSATNFVQYSDNESIVRLREVAEILENDTYTTEKMMRKLQKADPSAFARIGVPYYLFKDEKDLGKLMLGKGAGAAGVDIPKAMAGFVIDEDDDEFDTGIIPAFIYDYGFIGFGLLLVFVVTFLWKLPFTFWLFFVMLLPNANINTQLFWFLIAAFLGTSLFALRAATVGDDTVMTALAVK